jgi:hypothetical protein
MGRLSPGGGGLILSGAVVDTEPEPVGLLAKSSTGSGALDFPNMPLSTEETFGILIVRHAVRVAGCESDMVGFNSHVIAKSGMPRRGV